MVVAVGCESDCGGDEVYPATFGNEEKTGLKLDDGIGVAKTINFSYTITLLDIRPILFNLFDIILQC